MERRLRNAVALLCTGILAWSYVALGNTLPVSEEQPPPEGIYVVRIWDIGHDVLQEEPTWTGHVKLRHDGDDVYTGDWLEYSDHFSAFYSASTQLLTGAWFSEGNLLWGGIHFRWDGVRLTGKWSWYGRNGTGYEEWFPMGDDYVLPPMPPQMSPEDEIPDDISI